MEREWNGNLQAVQDLLSIFRKTECINYILYASFHLEKTEMLATEHPEIYRLFLSRHFVVKTNTVSLNGVATNVKLVQRNQRSKNVTVV